MKSSQKMIWYEMARRKLQFHPEEEWDKIKLWGLFNWGSVSKLIKEGKLHAPGYTRENKIVWVYPSKEIWETKIKPLTEKYTLKELTSLAGWEPGRKDKEQERNK